MDAWDELNGCVRELELGLELTGMHLSPQMRKACEHAIRLMRRRQMWLELTLAGPPHRAVRTMHDVAARAVWVSAALGLGWLVKAEPSRTSTDRKIPGTRLRSPGKGRSGVRLTISDAATSQQLLRHDTSETYRDVEDGVRNVVDLLRAAVFGEPKARGY